MRTSDYLSLILIAFIAIAFTLLIGHAIPGKQFEPYHLQLDSVWPKETGVQEYVVDINNDSLPEFFTHHSINQSGHSIDYRHNNNLQTFHIFYKNDFFISRFVHFVNVNQDQAKVIIFITAIDKIAWLNIYKYDPDMDEYKPIKKVEIGSVSYYNNKPDVINYSIVAHESEIYFDLTPGYSVKNRHIYKYSFANDSVSKTDKNSFVIKKLGLNNYGGKNYLLAKEMLATGNTMTQQEYEGMENSTNKDTMEMFKIYKPLKHLVYQYGDFSSYILLYNDSLKFTFEPIEFYGWTNFTISEFISINGIPHIIALTNTEKGDTANRVITLCDLQGKIMNRLPMPHDFTEIYSRNGMIVFKDKENLFMYSNRLEMIEQIPDITYSAGFFDINRDQKSEFVAFRDNKMLVFSSDFDILATFVINQEFAPYPEENGISLLQIGARHGLMFNTRLFYYLFSYSKNQYALFKYPFYIVVFFLWFGLLFLILKLNSKRLQNENLRLEKIVSDRTVELKSKNHELAYKNEEIQSQSEKITEQYERLEKLDQFKESLTHSLVHDLKNPLSQILINTSNRNVRNAAGKMLRLITNMLDVEKYETTEFDLNKEKYSLKEILEEVENGQEINLMEKNLKLNLHFDDYLILADKELMTRVFDNLLSNAIRYSPLNRNIDVFTEALANDAIKISMRNYGETIPEEALPFIFDKYRQFGKTDSSSHRSTGLGLTFCKMAVEAHGGNIGVSSMPEEGTDFWFTLPYALKNGEMDENEIATQDDHRTIQLSETDIEVLKEAVNQVKEFEIFEISRFHEILDPLRDTSGGDVNDWITLIFSAVYIQNTDELDRLIKLAENGKTENTDR